MLKVAFYELLVQPHEVEPWFHSWYRSRVETLNSPLGGDQIAMYNVQWIWI